MLDIPEKLVPYVNDYKLLLVEVRENNLILNNMNNRDLFNLLQIILDDNLSETETKENMAKGKAEGIIQILKKQNKSDDEIISELMSTLNISRNIAIEHLDNYNKNLL